MAICFLFFAVLPQHLCAEFSSIPLTCCSIMRAFRSRAFRFLVFHGRKKKKKKGTFLCPCKWWRPFCRGNGFGLMARTRGEVQQMLRPGRVAVSQAWDPPKPPGPSKTPQPLALPVRACHSLALVKPPSARVSVSILCDGKWLYRTGGSGDCWCPRPLCCCQCR